MTYGLFFKRFFILIILLSSLLPAYGYGDKKGNDRLILEKGKRFFREMRYDSALNTYQTIARKYRPDLSPEEKADCIDAIFGCFDSNLHLCNYTAAFNDLLLAEDLCENGNRSNNSKLHAYYASLYVVLASQTEKKKYLEMMIPHARTAFSEAYSEKEFDIVCKSYGDLVNAYAILKREAIVEKETRLLRNIGNNNWRIKEALLKYEGRKAMNHGDYKYAAKCFDSITDIIPHRRENMRAIAIAIKDKGVASGLGGNRHSAIRTLKEVIRLSYLCNQRDLRLGALNGIWIFAQENGDSANYNESHRHAIALRDSLKSYQIAGDMIELEYVKERKELQQQVSAAKLRHKIMLWSCAGISVIALTVIIFMSVLRRKNRILAYRTDLLRERMRELYRKEKKHTQDRNSNDKASQKYEGSSLSDKDKFEIAKEIEYVIHSKAVYSQDFSLNTLAESIGRHPKAVSQVINEVFKTNFSTCVNRIRIVEACRMFDDPAYSNWAVEGIAEATGFNSRSAFSYNFKKITGMSFKEYKKNCQIHEVDII